MAVSVTCPGCRTSYPVTDDLLGKKIRCKKCQETFTASAPRNGTVRAADERIQTRPGAARSAGDGSQRNGNAAAEPPMVKPVTGMTRKTMIAIAATAGGLVAAMGGIALWAILNRTTDNDNASVTPPPPPPRVTTSTDPGPATQIDPDDGKATPTNPAAAPAAGPTNTAGPDATNAAAAVVNQLLQTSVRLPRPGDFRPGALGRVEKSAVMIRCTTENGLGYGSGWIAEKNNQERYVVTNSHVVHMKEPANPPPERIEVVIHSGTSEERVLEGKLLAINREVDLAVIRIKAPDLPEPLTVSPSHDLDVGQRLMIVGFPHGGMLARQVRGASGADLKVTVKTRPSTVTGRHFYEDGSVRRIQVEGGADPGNSGGAVVDTNGDVVAVLVEGIPGTNMRFVIPSEYVLHLLHGQVQRVVPGQAIRAGGGVRQTITASFADPMHRLSRVSLDVWAGKPGKVRPASEGQPNAQPGDGRRVTGELAYDPNRPPALGESYTASCDLNLPALQPGEVYWLQPHYTSVARKERWGEAVILEMGRSPVDARSTTLAIKHKVDPRPEDGRQLELRETAIEYTLEDVGSRHFMDDLTCALTERTYAVADNGDAKVRLEYRKLQMGDADDDTVIRKQLRGVLEKIRDVKIEVNVTPQGRYRSPKTVWGGVTPQPILRTVNQEVIEALETLTLQLPNRALQPGDTWPAEWHFTVVVDSTTRFVTMRLTCKYVGTRTRDGREEAVVEITGVAGPGSARPMTDGGQPGDDPGRDGRDAPGRGGRGAPGRGGRGGPGGDGPGSDGPTAPGIGGQPPSRGGAAPGTEDVSTRNLVQGSALGAATVDVATGHVTLSRIVSEMSIEFPIMVRDITGRSTSLKVYTGVRLEQELRRSLTRNPPKDAKQSPMDQLLPNQPKIYNPLVGVGSVVAAEAPATTPSYAKSTALPRDVLDKIQKAAVIVRVITNTQVTPGSGWFAEPGIVVTNCHVLDMLSKTHRQPEKIEVVLDSGLPSERKLEGKVLMVDRENDLAAIRVQGANLPEPIPIKSGADPAVLPTASTLTVLGFPLTAGRKATFQARPTTVVGRMASADDSVRFIQLEGGADAGTAGAAVVDATGAVRAVYRDSVAGTQIRWGIPGEYVARLLQGCPLEVEPGRPYRDGTAAKQPVEVKVSDPMKRVTKLSLDVWLGNGGKPRRPTTEEPKSAAGDGPRRTFALKYDADKQIALGDLPFPDVEAGRVVWMQPRFVNGSGQNQWGQAIAYTPDGTPLDRRPVKLEFRPNRMNDERTLELSSEANFQWRQVGKLLREGYPLKATLTEKTLPRNTSAIPTLRGYRLPTGGGVVELKYTDLVLDAPIQTGVPQLDSEVRVLLRQFTNLIKAVTTYISVTRDGLVKNPRPVYPPELGDALTILPKFNTQIMQSLAALSIPLPNKEVKYGDTWEHPTNLFIETRNRYEATLFKMKLKYVGVRDRGGRQEAVIEIEGSLAKDPNAKAIDAPNVMDTDPDGGPPANRGGGGGMLLRQPDSKAQDVKGTKGLYGMAKGYAYVDVTNGFVAEVQLFIDMDAELTVKDPTTNADLTVMSSGTMDLLLRRLGK